MSQASQQSKLKDPRVRLQMIEVVGKLEAANAIEKLVAFLIDEEDSIRQAAEATLTKIDGQWDKSEAAKRALPILEAALNNDNYWIGLAANEVIKRISGGPAVVSEVPDEHATVTNRFVCQRRDAAKILVSALKDADADLRLAAIEGLARIGEKDFIDSLVASLNDPDEWVRWYAANALQTVGWQPSDDTQKAVFLVVLRKWDEALKLKEISVDPFIVALQSCNGKIRENAANALAKLKDARAELPLADCLQDKNKSVRRAAAKALSGMGGKSLNDDQRQLLAAELKP